MLRKSSRFQRGSSFSLVQAQYAVAGNACKSDMICVALFSLSARFNNAMATIRRVPAIDHNFQLVITRVYEDEDEELIEDEEESTSVSS